MTNPNDLVTTLRNRVYLVPYGELNGLLLQAADEIERLQAELALAVKWRDNYKQAWERTMNQARLDEHGIVTSETEPF